MLTAVLWCLFASQAASSAVEDISRYVRDLGNEDTAVREKAMASLKELPYRMADQLRDLSKMELDLEKRERLKVVVRHLVGKEGEALYQEGKLKEALLKMAESGGAADPSAEFERRVRLAREFLEKQFEVPQGKRIPYPPEQIKVLMQEHGRWALIPLIEYLGTPKSYDAFHFIKLGLGRDARPALCSALRGPDAANTNQLCAVLAALGPEELTIKTLKSVMEDRSRSQESRDSARLALRVLRVIEDEK